MEEFQLPVSVSEELFLPTMKPRVEFYEDSVIYLILHFPAFRHTHAGEQNQEVDFVIGKNFLITTRYDTIDPLHKFSKIFEVNNILDKSAIGDNVGELFFHMIRKLYKSLEHELGYMHDALRDIESKIFSGKEREMVVELSRISRALINFKHAVSLHNEVLESFEIAARRFFGEAYSYHIHSILGEYYRIDNGITINMDTLHELRETNNSMLSTKQNEIMKNLTIMAFVTIPLSLIAALFDMGATATPIVGHPFDFWILLSIMAGLALLFVGYFYYKKWL